MSSDEKRSKLIPGQIKLPVSFVFVILLIIVTAIFAQLSFDYLVMVQLNRLESTQGSAQIAPQTAPNEEVVQITTNAMKTAETELIKNEVVASRGRSRTAPEPVSLGVFKISWYCSCEICCGKTNGVMANGEQVYTGAVACDTNVIPMGTKISIEGLGSYTVCDRGGAIQGNRIDVYVADHQTALNNGIRYSEVYLLN